jgi:predicted DNA-binding transcriptional regulator AlpA
MLEQSIGRLAEQIERLRDALNEQNALLRGRQPRDLQLPARITPSPSLDEKSVAEMLRLSVSVLRKWRVLRKGPPFKRLGRAVRYLRADVVQWLESQSNSDTAA